MSIKIMSWVWENSTTKGSHRLVLLALADSANDDGVCWPGMNSISKKANLARRYIVDILGSLEKDGRIQVQRRREGKKNRSNIYQVITGVVNSASLGSEEGFTRGSEAEFTRVVRPASPDPSLNPKELNVTDPAAVAAAPPSPLTPGQRMFLAAFGAKRFSNGLQAQTIADLEIHFGYERLAEVVAWAAKKGMTRGQAIAAIEKAIPTWGQPKGNGASGMPGKQIGPQNEPASWGAIRAWAEKENVYGDEG